MEYTFGNELNKDGVNLSPKDAIFSSQVGLNCNFFLNTIIYFFLILRRTSNGNVPTRVYTLSNVSQVRMNELFFFNYFRLSYVLFFIYSLQRRNNVIVYATLRCMIIHSYNMYRNKIDNIVIVFQLLESSTAQHKSQG